MIFQLSLTSPPQVLKEGDHPSFQLKQAKKIDKERGHVSVKGQIISECPYEIIVSPKIPTKKFPRFLP